MDFAEKRMEAEKLINSSRQLEKVSSDRTKLYWLAKRRKYLWQVKVYLKNVHKAKHQVSPLIHFSIFFNYSFTEAVRKSEPIYHNNFANQRFRVTVLDGVSKNLNKFHLN